MKACPCPPPALEAVPELVPLDRFAVSAVLDAPPALELWLAVADASLVLVGPMPVVPGAVVAAAVWLPVTLAAVPLAVEPPSGVS